MAVLDTILEAEKRGLPIPEDKMALISEARKRGLVPAIDANATEPVKQSRPSVKDFLKQELFLDDIAEVTKKSALPLAGGIIGAGISTRLGLGPIPGESVGSTIGEAVNQYFGITEESLSQLAIEAVAPPVGRAVSGVLKTASKVVTPGSGAKFLNELVGPESELLLSKLEPKERASALFKIADNLGGNIPMTNTINSLDAKIAKMSKLSTPPTALRPLKRLRSKLEEFGGQLSPSELQDELELFGELGFSIQKKGGTGVGELKQTFKDMVTDLDFASDVAGADVLRHARDTFKKGKSVENLRSFIDKATSVLRGSGESVQFNAKTVINNLKKDKFYKKAFSGQEQKEISDLLTRLNKIPGLGPTGGRSTSLYRALTETMFGAAGMNLGFRAGGVSGAAIGASAALIPAALDISRNLALALQMESGRALLGDLIVKGTLDARGAAILSIFVASQTAKSPQEPSPNKRTP